MTKEIEKLELAILSDVFRYRRVVDLTPYYRVFRRDRESNRIPIQTLERLTNKNCKVREFVYRGIRALYNQVVQSALLCES